MKGIINNGGLNADRKGNKMRNRLIAFLFCMIMVVSLGCIESQKMPNSNETRIATPEPTLEQKIPIYNETKPLEFNGTFETWSRGYWSNLSYKKPYFRVITNYSEWNIFLEEQEYFLYLFTWDEIPGKDDARLIEFLNGKYNIYWLKTATIEKTDNNRTIKVFSGNNSLYLILNDEETKVDIKIDDDRTDELIAKTKNSKRSIFYPRGRLRLEGELFPGIDKMQKIIEPADFNNYFIIAAMMGYKTKRSPSIEVKNIQRLNSMVDVAVLIYNPSSGESVESAPYHIVIVKKEVLPRGNSTFVFTNTEGKELGKVEVKESTLAS